ncbi:MAG: hypothetical protein COA84_12170 [Robiginitomaculum sp.]|nr:MAG: hypothetical protein COA84_12170 [Robiginitomaculum sp.]
MRLDHRFGVKFLRRMAIAALLFLTLSADATSAAEFLVNTITIGNQKLPAIAALAGGGFVIAWQDESQSGDDSSLGAIRAQRFDSKGLAQGPEFLVITTTLLDQSSPGVAALAGGGFVIVWQDSSLSPDDPSGTAIRADIVAIPTTLFSSVLPSARSGSFGGAADAPGVSRPAAVGDPITVFASVINAGANLAQNCVISVPAASPVTLSYQQTDAANVPMGPADAPFDIAGGQSRSFILAFTPVATSPGKDVFPDFSCEDANVDAIPGVNMVFLTIKGQAGPDVLSIGATTSGDGIINIPTGGIGFMTMAAINIGVGDAGGSSDAAVTVSVDTGAASLPVLLQLCETDAAGACFDPLGTGPVDSVIGAGPSFFAVFVTDQSTNGIALDAANARAFVRFKDAAAGTNLSVTSAAITVPAAADAPVKAASPLPSAIGGSSNKKPLNKVSSLYIFDARILVARSSAEY